MRILLALAAAVSAAGGCIPVPGDRILARDLADAWPAFAAVAGETVVAFAPAPGVRRAMGAGELVRLANRFNVHATGAAEVCFERPMTTLTEAEVLATMRASLAAYPEARIEIVALSRYPVPRGEVVFRAQGLQSPGSAAAPRTPTSWTGEVRYGAGRRFAVWARVIVTVPLLRVRAAATLKAGEIVQAGALRVETGEGFPHPLRQAGTIEQVVGREVRRTIPEGSLIALDMLADPPEVLRGETVRVEVSSGSARLALRGRSESSGSRGETVRVRNLETQRTFPARISGKGTVVVNTMGEKP